MSGKSSIFNSTIIVSTTNPDYENEALIAGKILKIGTYTKGQSRFTMNSWAIAPGYHTYYRKDLDRLMCFARSIALIKRLCYFSWDEIIHLITDLNRIMYEEGMECSFNCKKTKQIQKIIRKGKRRLEEASRNGGIH